MAHQAQLEALRAGYHIRERQNPRSQFLHEGERIEIITRAIVKERFSGTIAGKVPKEQFKELERVLFSITYPTPPPG